MFLFFLRSCYFIYSLGISIIVLWSFALLLTLLPCPLLNLHHGTDNSVYSSSMAWAKLTEENRYRNFPVSTFSSLLFSWRAVIWWICYSSNSKIKKKIKTNNSYSFNYYLCVNLWSLNLHFRTFSYTRAGSRSATAYQTFPPEDSETNANATCLYQTNFKPIFHFHPQRYLFSFSVSQIWEVEPLSWSRARLSLQITLPRKHPLSPSLAA